MELLSKTVKTTGNVYIQEKNDNKRYTLSVTPESESVCLEDISVSFRFDYSEDDVYFLNGYQSWTYSPERTIKQYDDSLRFCPRLLDKKFGFSQYGDGYYVPKLSVRKLRKGLKKGYTYAYVRRGAEFFLFASLSDNTGFTRIYLDPSSNTVTFQKDCTNRTVRSGENYLALDIIFDKGSEKKVFDNWFEMMGIKALPAKDKVGYTSWYNCYQNISEQQILHDLDGMKTLKVKPDIFQIDDGFETYVGDWFDIDKNKFPGRIEPIIKKILDNGYQAGIWLAPFVAEKNSVLFREHPDWFQQKDGKPVFTGANWSGGYALDPCNKEVREYIVNTVEHYKSMGITLFKLDFLYAACMSSRPDKTRGEIMHESMSFLREVCGNAEILGCGVPLCSAFGKVEYCRIGPDMSLNYDDKPYMRLFHNERPSTMHTQRNTVYRRQLNGRAFLNDPDVFLLRDENTTLSNGQKQTLATINSLFGSVLFGSDDFGKYDSSKHDLFANLCEMLHAENISAEPMDIGKAHKIKVRYTVHGKENESILQI